MRKSQESDSFSDDFLLTNSSWSFSHPEPSDYLAQKGIRLQRARNARRLRSQMPALPVPEQLRLDAHGLRRWRYFFSPRLTAASLDELCAPHMFRGELERQPNPAGEDACQLPWLDPYGALQYDYFLQIEALLLDARAPLKSRVGQEDSGIEPVSEGAGAKQDKHGGARLAGNGAKHEAPLMSGSVADQIGKRSELPALSEASSPVGWPWLYCQAPPIEQFEFEEFSDGQHGQDEPGGQDELDEQDARDTRDTWDTWDARGAQVAQAAQDVQSLRLARFAQVLKPLSQVQSEISMKFADRQACSLDSEEVRICLNLIHEAWSPGSNSLNYDAASVDVARLVLKNQKKPVSWVIPLFFEIEMFASYMTVLCKQEVVGSGFYEGRWLDVISLPIAQFRLTEQCQSDRILHELENIPAGRVAPIIINETGCVADGNHRLTAALIWNILHNLADCSWSIEDDGFQRGIAEQFWCMQKEKMQLTSHEALRCLGELLQEQTSKKILDSLRAAITRSPIEKLPALPYLEYSAIAVLAGDYAADYKDSGRILRLAPRIYDILVEKPNLVLKARACYHFADRVPLPWFRIT